MEVQAVRREGQALGPFDDDDAAAVEQLGEGQIVGVGVAGEAVGIDVVDQQRLGAG